MVCFPLSDMATDLDSFDEFLRICLELPFTSSQVVRTSRDGAPRTNGRFRNVSIYTHRADSVRLIISTGGRSDKGTLDAYPLANANK